MRLYSKVRALLRKVAVLIRGSQVEPIGRAISAVTPGYTVGFFSHYGYHPPLTIM